MFRFISNDKVVQTVAVPLDSLENYFKDLAEQEWAVEDMNGQSFRHENWPLVKADREFRVRLSDQSHTSEDAAIERRRRLGLWQAIDSHRM